MTHTIWAKEQLAKYTTSFAKVMMGQSTTITIIITSANGKLQDIVTFPPDDGKSNVGLVRRIVQEHNQRVTSFHEDTRKKLDSICIDNLATLREGWTK